MTYEEQVEILRSAYCEKKLTLYLGAGVSVGNGLPPWEQLVLAMYYSTLSGPDIGAGLRPFPNYLFAIAEWHLQRRHEPLDISARKIRSRFHSATDFLKELKETLYAGFSIPDSGRFQIPDTYSILEANSTLRAVTDLCENHNDSRALHAIVTYNYDNLLEFALEGRGIRVQPIWKAKAPAVHDGVLPVYHVHGYVPIEGSGSSGDELVFTEEQYHLAAHDAYSWSNLVQIQCMSSSTGLMIGLSLSDRNMRRLLDAIRKTPLRSNNYALMLKPRHQVIGENDVREIDENARKYFERFVRSGIKSDDRVFKEIRAIVKQVEDIDQKAHESILRELGVWPLWYDDHQQIPELIARILA